MRSAPSHLPHGELPCASSPGGSEGTRALRVGTATTSRGCAAHVWSAVPARGAAPRAGSGTGCAGQEVAVARLGSHALSWHGTEGGHDIAMGLTLSRRGSLAGPPRL